MKRSVLSGLVICLLLTLPLGANAAPEKGAKIEVVFVLDTTGSMSWLIQGAKEKIWAIANTMATVKPAPDIKMGLLGYRDRGDAYVTKLTPLTADLDAVYKDLMTFSADGGGDGPESVNQALHEAVTKIDWSKDEETYKVIFLVGDYPPHMDYQNDVAYPESCRSAVKSDIIINTIQCGSFADTTPIWREIARLAEGRFFQVEQSGGALLPETPFDEELARLARELDDTRIFYGDADTMTAQNERVRNAAEIYEASSSAAQAQRATFNASFAGQKNLCGDRELVNDVKNKAVRIEEIKEEHLPENMRMMSPAERTAYLREKAESREVVQNKINMLSEKRQAFIKDFLAKKGMDVKNSFDRAIFECVQSQGAKKGIKYDEEMH